jgi:hypothetical protein
MVVTTTRSFRERINGKAFDSSGPTLMTAGMNGAAAQDYPSRTVTVIAKRFGCRKPMVSSLRSLTAAQSSAPSVLRKQSSSTRPAPSSKALSAGNARACTTPPSSAGSGRRRPRAERYHRRSHRRLLRSRHRAGRRLAKGAEGPAFGQPLRRTQHGARATPCSTRSTPQGGDGGVGSSRMPALLRSRAGLLL